MTLHLSRRHEAPILPRDAEPEPAPRVDGVTIAILVAGLIPIVGFAITGRWPQGDLAVAVLFVLFALYQLAFGRGRPR